MNTQLQIAEADPTTLPVGTQLVQVCPRLGTGTTVLVYNNDITNVAYVGYRTAGLTISNSIPVQPLASVTVSGARVLYGFCPTATVQLTIVPSGTAISPSPAQIQQQINTLGLATSGNQTIQLNQGQIQLGLTASQLALYSQSPNPAFSDGSGNASPAGWTSGTLTTQTAGVNGAVALPSGSGYANGIFATPLTINSSTRLNSIAGFPCNPGDIPTAHVMIYPTHISAGTTGAITFAFFDSTGTFISTTPQLTPALVLNAWNKISFPASTVNAAPVNTATASCFAGLQNPNVGGVPATDTFYMTAFYSYDVNSEGVVPSSTVARQTAALIANGNISGTPGGTPLLHGLHQLSSNTNLNVPAFSTVTLGPFTVTKPGYWGRVGITNNSVATTVSFATVRLIWRDSATGLFTGGETWTIPIGPTTGDTHIAIRGSCKGNTVELDVTNPDPLVPLQFIYALNETTHHIARDDWRQLAGDTPPTGFNAPPGVLAEANMLTAGSTALAISGTQKFLLPLYAGEVFVNFVASSGTTADYILSIPPGVTGAGAQLFNDTASGFTGRFIFPRIPVLVTLTNPSATVTTTVSTTIMMQEYAS